MIIDNKLRNGREVFDLWPKEVQILTVAKSIFSLFSKTVGSFLSLFAKVVAREVFSELIKFPAAVYVERVFLAISRTGVPTRAPDRNSHTA